MSAKNKEVLQVHPATLVEIGGRITGVEKVRELEQVSEVDHAVAVEVAHYDRFDDGNRDGALDGAASTVIGHDRNGSRADDVVVAATSMAQAAH